MAVGHENVAGGIPRDVRRSVECVTGTAGARGAATSSGRRPASCASFASRAFRRRRLDHANVDRFRFSAHDHQHSSFRAELDDLTGRLIDRPYVVLWVDANPVRHQKTIDTLTNFSDVVPILVELEQTRSAMRDDARGSHHCRRVACPCVNEHVSFRVGRNTGGFAEVNLGGHF
jgi:hypothetical protein